MEHYSPTLEGGGTTCGAQVWPARRFSVIPSSIKASLTSSHLSANYSISSLKLQNKDLSQHLCMALCSADFSPLLNSLDLLGGGLFLLSFIHFWFVFICFGFFLCFVFFVVVWELWGFFASLF